MTANRYRNAWIWLAVAALAVASVSRAQAGVQYATAYANPVFEFLTGHQNGAVSSPAGMPGVRQHSSAGRTRAVSLHGSDASAWLALLPAVFVGLVSPLNILSASSALCLDRTDAAPALPSRFQRPPPSLFA